VGAELFHSDGWRDTTKLIVTFCNFVNVCEKIKRKSAEKILFFSIVSKNLKIKKYE
jgi:hypothetical protein